MRLPSLLVISFFFLTSCTTLAPKFKGSVFLHHQIPEGTKPEDLKEYGIYRKLANGDEEYLPYTSKEIKNYISVHKDDFILVEESTE